MCVESSASRRTRRIRSLASSSTAVAFASWPVRMKAPANSKSLAKLSGRLPVVSQQRFLRAIEALGAEQRFAEQSQKGGVLLVGGERLEKHRMRLRRRPCATWLRQTGARRCARWAADGGLARNIRGLRPNLPPPAANWPARRKLRAARSECRSFSASSPSTAWRAGFSGSSTAMDS